MVFPPSPSPQATGSGPFPGKVLLIDTARSPWGITSMGGKDSRSCLVPEISTHPFPQFLLSVETKSRNDVYSAYVLKLGLPVSPL